jgi:nitroimidazol reductase NimA-like FMN-containing flavoprotein (pyridoxamine 5'-phosphate oxidase superfamily)
MSKDYLNAPPTAVRRDDRAVTDEQWIRDLLNRAPIGYLATVHDGQPFINSNLFYYDEAKHAIYFHTARVGRTRANVDNDGEKVCFTVTEMGRLLPADEALEFSVEYSGVVVFGKATVVSGQEEETYCLQAILDKYAPHLHPERDYRPITPEELKRTSTFRIEINSWSGKRKEVADDFPGAFRYGEFS